jgi:hypothetical protein
MQLWNVGFAGRMTVRHAVAMSMVLGVGRPILAIRPFFFLDNAERTAMGRAGKGRARVRVAHVTLSNGTSRAR